MSASCPTSYISTWWEIMEPKDGLPYLNVITYLLVELKLVFSSTNMITFLCALKLTAQSKTSCSTSYISCLTNYFHFQRC